MSISNIRVFLLLLIQLLANIQFGFSQKCGVGEIKDFDPLIHPEEITNGTHVFNEKFWFKDSCIIYEHKVEFEGDIFSEKEGILHKKGYFVLKYIYQDLRTMICQDYTNFSDTAKPIANYTLKKGEWVFTRQLYRQVLTKTFKEDNIEIPDTIINNIKYRRIRTSYNLPNYPYIHISYLDCSSPKSIVYLSQQLDDIYFPCKTIRWERYNQSNNIISWVEQKITPGLSKKESKIFCAWDKNALSTDLPLKSKEEVFQTQFLTPKFE